MKNDFYSQFLRGELSVNEFTVLVAVRAKARNGSVDTTTVEIADALGNNLSRHAVARSLRSLQRKNQLDWVTVPGGISTIFIR